MPSYADYIAQGFYPPCENAIYIPSSSPVTKGDFLLSPAPNSPWTSVLYVAWEQQVMKTGGVYDHRLWWVPVSELKSARQ